jgi:hypothetical protein
VAADQRNLTAAVSIADIAAKVENDHRESVMKLAQAHSVSAKMVHAALHKDLPLSGSWQLSDKTALRGEEEGAIQNVPGDHSDDRHGFLTILDNVLTVGGLTRGKNQAGRPQPQSGGLPEGAGRGTKNDAVANFA